jgi:hypothetical protein
MWAINVGDVGENVGARSGPGFLAAFGAVFRSGSLSRRRQGPMAVPRKDALLAGAGFIAPRALELLFTAWDLHRYADDLWREADADLRAAIERQWCENREATGGHPYDPPEWYTPPEDRCPLPPFKWNDDRRARLRAELDAYYAKLYGLDERDLRYILDPTDVYGPDFPGETFRVLKEKEIARYGEYRTRRLVLEAWERLHRQGAFA